MILDSFVVLFVFVCLFDFFILGAKRGDFGFQLYLWLPLFCK